MPSKRYPSGEAVIESGRAILKVNGLTRIPGRLKLTNRKLVFSRKCPMLRFFFRSSHTPVCQIKLDRIADILFPPDGLTIVTRAGRELRFQVQIDRWKMPLWNVLEANASASKSEPSYLLNVAVS